MLKRITKSVVVFLVAAGVFTSARDALAITAYGVNAAGTLFSFDVAAPASVTTIGPVTVANTAIFPEAIDFRPGTSTLYAIDIGATTSQLYTINISTGAATPVGAGFASVGAGYSFTPNDSIGFDFNPTTLQAADQSMRIRLVGTGGSNVRLHSATGAVAGIDTPLAIGTNSPFVSGAAYINNRPTIGGTTTLYDMDSRNNSLYIQNPPNNGTLNLVGPFGATINNSLPGIGFDIYTDPSSTDTTIAGDTAFAVLKRPDAPIGGPLGAYLLYNVNLSSGAITGGALVGPAATPFDFEGGFAVNPIPEPATVLLALLGVAGLWLRRW